MNRLFLCLAGLAVAGSVTAADLLFPLETFPVNEPPPGFVSLLAGAGQPGDWRVKLDEVGTAVPETVLIRQVSLKSANVSSS
jgi:hypothetical protein